MCKVSTTLLSLASATGAIETRELCQPPFHQQFYLEYGVVVALFERRIMPSTKDERLIACNMTFIGGKFAPVGRVPAHLPQLTSVIR